MTRHFAKKWKGAAAGLAVTGLAFSMAATGVLAQEEATPAAGTGTVTVDANTGFVAPAVDKAALTEAIQTLTGTLVLVQSDRDAIAGTIDVTEIDGLIVKATALRDSAKAALASDDASLAPESIHAGMMTAHAAYALIDAEASAYGLPSQQAATSRALVQAYYAIDETGDLVAQSADADGQFFVDTAERLYTRAYDLYNAGTYTQAAKTANVARHLASIAGALQFDMMFAGGGPGVTVEGHMDAGKPGGAHDGGVMRGDPNDPHAGGMMHGSGNMDMPGANMQGGMESGQTEMVGPDGMHGMEPGMMIVSGDGAIHGSMHGPGALGGHGAMGSGMMMPGGMDASDTPLEVPAPNFD